MQRSLPDFCCFQICMKKEDIIRHFKWHKKRSDSLQHGFMRFSPMEDCSQKFRQVACIHKGKHTHYHCLQVRNTPFFIFPKVIFIAKPAERCN